MSDLLKHRKINVLYIGGEGRSGSTLLSHFLGRYPTAFIAGELSWIWQRGFIQNEICGCGEKFLTCPEWNTILKESRQQFLRESSTLSAVWKKHTRTRNLLRELIGQSRFNLDSDLVGYLEAVTTLYRQIQSTTDCQFIVDSSKSPAYAFLLNRITEIELYVLHLVRDPRGVAYSRQRRKIRPEDGQEMIRFRPAFSAFLWSVNNLAIELLRHRLASRHHYFRLRYEDFVLDPEMSIARLVDTMPELFSSSGDANLHKAAAEIHTVSGNPVRFELGSMSIEPDFEWIREMKWSHRLIVDITTLPLLKRYGYRLVSN